QEAELKAREDAKRIAEEGKRVVEPEELQPNAPPAEKEDTKHGKKKERREKDVDEESKHRKRAGKAAKRTLGPKKGSKADLYALVEDEGLSDEVLARRKSMRAQHKASNKHAFKKPTTKIVHEVEIPETIVVADLAQR